MKRAKRILTSLRLAESFFLLNWSSPARSLHSHSQVTKNSKISSLLSSCLQQIVPHNKDYNLFYNIHRSLYFSSNPNSLVELVTTQEWSQDLEMELEKLDPTPSHETVVYVLKHLDEKPRKALDFFNWAFDKCGFKPSLPVYSLMLRILGDKQTISEFWDLIQKMSIEGCNVDDKTYRVIFAKFKDSNMCEDLNSWKHFFATEERVADAIIKSVVNVVLESDWNKNVEKELEDLDVTYTEDIILRIITKLHMCPLKALRFFRWLETYTGYNSVVTYNSIIRALGQEESTKEFWIMVRELKSSGHDIDIETYDLITRQFLKKDMMEDAVELYELMMDSPYKPSLSTCNSLLKHISWKDTPDLSLIFRFVKKYTSLGRALTKDMYDCILRSLSTVGRSDVAGEVFESMRSVGYEPDSFSYSQVMFGLCKAGKVEDAFKILDEMEAQGFIPDLKTWTALIQGCFSIGEIEQALKCYTKMLEKHLEPDAGLLEVLVNSLSSNGRVDHAYNLLIEVVGKTNLKPSLFTYKVLIRKLRGENKLEEAKSLLSLMKKHNYRTNC